MKTLKKLFSLLLVLTLAAGVLALPAGAMRRDLSFWPDADDFDWDYRQAAEVMVYLDILEGDEGGMRPLDTITRAEACKIISFILLGPMAGEMEGEITPSTYSDVPEDEWYAGYVAYCTRTGIVSGDNGDGTGPFRPNDEITGYEFGKMCLCAIGYDSRFQGFEGDDWQAEIMDLAGRVGTSYNMKEGFSWSAPITRQEAFQMAIDAMEKDVVVKSYDPAGMVVGYEEETLENILRSKYDTVHVTDVIQELEGDLYRKRLGDYYLENIDDEYLGMVASAYLCFEDVDQLYCITIHYLGW